MKVKKEQLNILLKLSRIMLQKLTHGHDIGWYETDYDNLLSYWKHNPRFKKAITKHIIGKEFSWEYYSVTNNKKISFIQTISTEQWRCSFKTPTVLKNTKNKISFQKAYGKSTVFETDIVLIEFLFQAGEFNENIR